MFFYLLIKFGSDFSVSNKGLIINSEIDDAKLRHNSNNLRNLLDIVQQSNDNVFIIKGLPVNLNELASSTGDIDKYYLRSIIDFNSIATTHNDMLCIKNEKSIYDSFAARMVYDEFVKHGNFEVRSGSYAKLFKINRLVKTSELNSLFLYRRKKYSAINIVNFNSLQCRIFETKKHIFSKGNALQLLLSLEGFIRVMNC